MYSIVYLTNFGYYVTRALQLNYRYSGHTRKLVLSLSCRALFSTFFPFATTVYKRLYIYFMTCKMREAFFFYLFAQSATCCHATTDGSIEINFTVVLIARSDFSKT